MDTKKLPVGLPVLINIPDTFKDKPAVVVDVEENVCHCTIGINTGVSVPMSSVKIPYPTTTDYFKRVMMAEGWESPYRYTSFNKGGYGKRLGIFIEKYEVRTAFEATKLWSDIDMERVKEFQQALAHATALKAIREYETQNK